MQIVPLEDAGESQLRCCHYKVGEFVNRPSTIAPIPEGTQRIDEAVETMVSLARPFTADEIEALVEEFGGKSLCCPFPLRS